MKWEAKHHATCRSELRVKEKIEASNTEKEKMDVVIALGLCIQARQTTIERVLTAPMTLDW